MTTDYNRKQWALFIVRVTLGIIFIAHGGQKVLGLFGGTGLEGFVKWIGGLGVPSWLAYLAAFAEFTGGVLLLLGVAAELGALLTIPVMLGAVTVVHWKHGFFSQDKGFEYPLSLIFFALAIIVGGPGKYALWNCFKRYKDRS
jgi:putative oxidoreductase